MTTNLQVQSKQKKSKKETDKATETTVTQDHQDFSITFNYEFLDDSYAKKADTESDDREGKKSNLPMFRSASVKPVPPKWANESEVWDENHRLLPNARLYRKSTAELKRNHPLMIMVQNGRAVSHTTLVFFVLSRVTTRSELSRGAGFDSPSQRNYSCKKIIRCRHDN